MRGKFQQISQQTQNGTISELSLMHFLYDVCKASDLQENYDMVMFFL